MTSPENCACATPPRSERAAVMFTWQLDLQIHPKLWKERSLGWARGQNVILLKVSVFNQAISISSFVAGVHSFGLQMQVRRKRCSSRRERSKVES